MQPTNPITRTQPRANSQTPASSSSIAVQNVAETAKLQIGQQIQATILEQAGQGLYKVLAAGQTLQMQLPGQLKVGSQIALQVISTSPRLSFALASSSSPISTAEEISSASRLLSDLTLMPLSKPYVESASGRAVWPSAEKVPESNQLAVSLKEALGNSGLFYESHQAQWIAGTRSTAQLLVEPQNLLTHNAQSPAFHPGTSSQTVKQESASSLPSEKAASIASKAVSDGVTDKSSILPIAKELVPLVQQQLHTLETHQLTWSGEIWPNQQMQWEIQGEPERHSATPEERQWNTEVELALPKLGDVHARLQFSQGSVKLTLHASSEKAAALFTRNLSELASTMKSAGIPLASAAVEKP
jgi:hypothetical protein